MDTWRIYLADIHQHFLFLSHQAPTVGTFDKCPYKTNSPIDFVWLKKTINIR